MIEKLPFEITQGEYEGKKFDIKSHTSPFDMQVKINELVNAVNELQKNSTISKMEKIETPTENVQEDPESGQVDVLKWVRGEEYQWVGCLCELWSGNSKNHRYGILKGIAKNTYKGHKTIHKYQALSMSFEHCKPVKPDDDVIFKGE